MMWMICLFGENQWQTVLCLSSTSAPSTPSSSPAAYARPASTLNWSLIPCHTSIDQSHDEQCFEHDTEAIPFLRYSTAAGA